MNAAVAEDPSPEWLVRPFHGRRPVIVCLCGSTRFVQEFNTQKLGACPRAGRSSSAWRSWLLNPGGYLGHSTRAEITYATQIGKPITYLEDEA